MIHRANYNGTIILPLLVLSLVLGVHVSSAAELSAPTIVISPDVYYPLDEVLYLEGRADPNALVEVRFQKQGAKPLTFRTKSDSRGEWTLAEKIRLEAGDWEVRARTVDLENLENASEWSNPRIFKVAVSGITIGGITIKFAALSLAIIILLVIGAVITLYFAHRVSRLQRALLEKEIREAREAARDAISEMRAQILDELKLLESKKELSADELARKEHLLRDLENMERNMEKEIEDIEKEVS